MEKEGFIRSITNIESKGLKIEKIITDRHLQIQKHVRENMPNTTHNYDVWHVVKGIFSYNKSMQFMILEYNEIEKNIRIM